MALQNGKKPVSNLSSALASIHISRESQNNGDSILYNNNQQNIPQYNPSIDQQQYLNYGPPPPQNNQLNIPVDRIAEYRNNPPTEGVSLFSHRVSTIFLFTRNLSLSPPFTNPFYFFSLHRTDSRLLLFLLSSASSLELFSLILKKMNSVRHTTFL